MESLAHVVKRHFNRNLLIAFPIVCVCISVFFLYLYSKERRRIEDLLEKAIERKAGEISSQLVIYKLYDIPPDPNLLKSIEEIYSQIKIGIRYEGGQCALGDCEIFNYKSYAGSIYTVKEICTMDDIKASLGVYIPIGHDFLNHFVILLGILIVGFASVLCCTIYLNQSFIERELSIPLYRLQSLFRFLEDKDYRGIKNERNDSYQIREIQDILENFKNLALKVEKFTEAEKQVHAQKALSELASQVAHDIRSPVAALNMITSEMSEFPEDLRILIRSSVNRINDIANILIRKNRQFSAELTGTIGAEPIGQSEEVSEGAAEYLLFTLIDDLISEKRLQFRSKLGVEIQFAGAGSSQTLFSKVHAADFKRVISNLVNNAVEALDENGKVLITLGEMEGECVLKIQDNGKGIPPEVLPRLGKKGETFGKRGGSGLGLYHARSILENWGGTLEISSQLGVGTEVFVQLPKTAPPSWFVSELLLTPDSVVVIVDDDVTIHHTWIGRIDSARPLSSNIRVVHLSTPDELSAWVKENAPISRVTYLVDYEFIGHKSNGLDLIEELGIGEQSVLVTSRHEERNIKEICQRIQVAIIPKRIVGFIPIIIHT
jgi:signal transduction histidine kinase